MENAEKTKPETKKIEGISAQINLSPGSETHRRFAELMRETGALTARSFVEMLMDSYTSPHTDNSEAIERLQNQANKLSEEVTASHNLIEKQDQEIADLKAKLETAQKEANDNAVNGLGQQSQIEFLQEQNASLQKHIEGAIIVQPNPVSRYFLDEMASKTNTPADKILEKLFFEDLQNPRANNLPYTVTSSRIEKVMDELKKRQNNG